MITFGIIGLCVIAVAVWIRRELTQDILFAVGGLALLVYSIWLNDWVFIILQIVFILSALVEIVVQKKK